MAATGTKDAWGDPWGLSQSRVIAAVPRTSVTQCRHHTRARDSACQTAEAEPPLDQLRVNTADLATPREPPDGRSPNHRANWATAADPLWSQASSDSEPLLLWAAWPRFCKSPDQCEGQQSRWGRGAPRGRAMGSLGSLRSCCHADTSWRVFLSYHASLLDRASCEELTCEGFPLLRVGRPVRVAGRRVTRTLFFIW